MGRFHEIIAEKGFEVTGQDEEKIQIQKETNNNDFVIIFDKKNKYINGMLIPKRYIVTLKELEILNKEFGELKQHLEEFAKLSNYTLINKN